MRKIASHYWLRPDGSVGKFPIVIFNGYNNIVEIRERTEFEEESNLELVNGLLVPGFVDFLPEISAELTTDRLKRILNRYIISGVKLIGISNIQNQLLKSVSLHGIERVMSDIVAEKKGVTFDKIKLSTDSVSALMQYTFVNANKLDRQNVYGTIEVGKSPGLLTIQNMNYETLRLTEKSTLKIII